MSRTDLFFMKNSDDTQISAEITYYTSLSLCVWYSFT